MKTFIFMLFFVYPVISIPMLFTAQIQYNTIPNCPFGFQHYSKNECRKVKQNETFEEKFKNCIGNKDIKESFVASLLPKIGNHIIPMITNTYWTPNRFDKLEKYLESPSIMVYILEFNFNPKNECESFNVIDTNGTCVIRKSRSCVIKPIDMKLILKRKGKCQDKFLYYESPIPVCLTHVYEYDYKNLTRKDIKTACEKESSNLVGEGIIYINSTLEIPTSIINVNGHIQYENRPNVISKELQNIKDMCNFNSSSQDKYISLVNNTCILRNENHIYNAAVCEQPIDKNIIFENFTMKYMPDGIKLIINAKANYAISKKDIKCYSNFIEEKEIENYLTPIRLLETDSENAFELNTIGNGLYRCISISNNGEFIKSPLILFLNSMNDLTNTILCHIYNGDIYDLYKNILFNESINAEGLIKEWRLIRNDKRFKSYYITLDANYENITDVYETKEIQIMNLICEDRIKNIFIADGTRIVKNENELYIWNKTGHFYADLNCILHNKTKFKYTQAFIYHMIPIESYGKGEVHMRSTADYEGFTTLSTEIYETMSETEMYETTTETEIYNDTTGKYEIYTSRPIDDTIKHLINHTVNEKDIENVIKNLSQAVNISRKSSLSSDTMKNLDVVLKQINLNNNSRGEFHSSSKNLLVGVKKIVDIRPIAKCRLNSKRGNLENDTIEFLSSDTILNEDESDIIVDLKNFNVGGNLAIVVMNEETLLKPSTKQNESVVNSMIIGISAENHSFSNLHQYVDIHFKPFKTDIKYYEVMKCVFWDFEKSGWSTDGCEKIENHIINGLDTCRCTHLTHFAEILSPNSRNISKNHQTALTIITYISCTLSLLGLGIIATTAVTFERWREAFTNKIYLNLCAAIALLQITFLFNAFHERPPKSHLACLSFGIVLHYSVLAAFAWMFITAILAYRKLIRVFDSRFYHGLLKACVCGWLIPLIPVILLLSINHKSYFRQSTSEQRTLFCYPSGLGFWISVFLPIALMVLTNVILYIVIIINVFIKDNVKKDVNIMKKCKSVSVSFLMFFLFGLTWLFGLFSQILLMNYLFCLLATLQGFVMFLFFIVMNTNTRNMWRKKLRLKDTKKSKNSYDICQQISSERSKSTPLSDIPYTNQNRVASNVDPQEGIPILRSYAPQRLSAVM